MSIRALVHCKKSHVGMRQTPMLTTVAQNQTTWEKEFSDPPRRLVRATVVHIEISRSFFLQCSSHLLGDGRPAVIFQLHA